MKSLEQFKKELNVTEIKFVKNPETGTQQVEIEGKLILMRKDVDTKKPLFVGMITKNKNGEPVPPGTAYAVFNSKLVEGDTI